MFVAHLSDGKTIRESQATWDEIPDGITALEIELPVQLKKINNDTGEMVTLPPPTVELQDFDEYYFANEAVALVMAWQAGEMIAAPPGQGTVIKQVMAGIDRKHDLVVYIEVDRKANVKFKRFPCSKINWRPECIRKGVV